MQDNEYLTSYYRPQIQSVRHLIATGFFLFPHNETFNIWSHALGFLLFVGLAIYTATVITTEDTVVGAWRSVDGQAAAAVATPTAATATSAAAAAVAAARGQVASSAAAAVAAARGQVSAALGLPAWGAAEELFVALRHAPASVAAALATGALTVGSGGGGGGVGGDGGLNALGDGGLSALGDAAAHLRPALSRLLSEAWLYGFGPLLLGVCACMASSTTYHLLWNFSPSALKLLSRIDYCAIALLCASHSLTGSFWGFYCSPTPATTTPYTVGVLAATAATVVAIMHPRFDSPAFRTTRAVTFSVLGGICFAPLAHLGAVSGWHPEFTTEAVWLSGVAAAYLAGAILFATRYPECCARKGRYDLLGASHQLMHMCVIGAAALHWYVCVRNFRYRLVYGCTLSPLVPV